MVGGRSESGSRRPARAASVVVPFPNGGRDFRLDVARFVPSGRSLLVTVAVIACAAAAYVLARSTSMFAVERVEVKGAPPALQRRVVAITSDVVGHSLVSLDTSRVVGRVRALPTVAGVSVDRAFPHTLVVRVAPERSVALAQRGDRAWLVTGGGKVVGRVEPTTEQGLPRLWLPKSVFVEVGGRLPPSFVPATRTLAAVRDVGFRRAVKGVHFERGELTMALRNGLEIRLGPARDLALKVAVAGRVLRFVGEGTTFVDVSIPERPVAG